MFGIFKLLFKLIRWAITIAFIGAIVFVGYNAYGVWTSSKLDQRDKTDAIIVLGAAQFDGKPSPVFSNRLDHALELYKEEISPLVITVGGKQQGDRFTEAEAGFEYLNKTISKKNLKAITDGKDTLESFELIRNEFPDLKTVTLVSDPAHLWRSNLMAQNLGFKTQMSGTQSGPGSELSNSYFVREVASTLRYEFKRHFSSQWSLLRSIVL
jgi:vancomycin permeability regulator SanA